MYIEVDAAPEKTNLQGWPKNFTKQKFISPVTVDEMDIEDKLI